MDHLAIMSKKTPFLQRVLDGKKTIESRWYQSKRSPWNQAHVGDQIFFKNVGEMVTVRAEIVKVEQWDTVDSDFLVNLITLSAQSLGLLMTEIVPFIHKVQKKRYVIFFHLKNVTRIQPFAIDKKGFGAMAAWITVPDIKQIALPAQLH